MIMGEGNGRDDEMGGAGLMKLGWPGGGVHDEMWGG